MLHRVSPSWCGNDARESGAFAVPGGPRRPQGRGAGRLRRGTFPVAAPARRRYFH
ncbi:hypothetical protein C7S16_6970 [Burkholderia thailandensis]|uniref:Uncharacterized protein n=1 Tax=Burkholderia thailandensis TaxID=57975 RepID=A0AAW9CKS6_BURTH|nr:hypothetical protein [Burkholderia thailandensis]MDW9250737.1 hypothetical protein [Burkholderia thailandensis]